MGKKGSNRTNQTAKRIVNRSIYLSSLNIHNNCNCHTAVYIYIYEFNYSMIYLVILERLSTIIAPDFAFSLHMSGNKAEKVDRK